MKPIFLKLLRMSRKHPQIWAALAAVWFCAVVLSACGTTPAPAEAIAKKLKDPIAAEHLYRAVQREIDSICKSPFAFPDCSYYLIDHDNIRHSLVGSYVIYEVSEADETIKILRFLYGKRDVSKIEIIVE